MNNFVVIRGNLGRDPEVKYTTNGTAIARFSVAVNEEWTGADGQTKAKTSWIDCQAWSGLAEKLAAHYRKGTTVVVNGRLTVDSWEKDGKKFSKMLVTAETVTSPFYGKSEKVPPPPEPARPRQEQLPTGRTVGPVDDDSDVPF